MRDLIASKMRARRRDTGPLPSVRELALEFGASPRTVHLALRQLVGERVVQVVPRKGFFWGVSGPSEPARSETTEELFAARFLADLRQGGYHPWKALPGRKALAEVYGVGVRSAGRVVDRLIEREVLERRGREVFFTVPSRTPIRTSVLVVVRCDARGAFLLDTEREVDFLKSIRRELAERELGMVRVGYFQDEHRFLDQAGRELELARLRCPLLGAIVSTWLVSDPMALLRLLEPLKLPLSVWWEHPQDQFPSKRFRAGLAGFNLSFTESAGSAVGRHLAALGRLDVAFVSPYHGNDWSPARLEGLKGVLSALGGRVQPFVAEEIHSPWDLRRRSGGGADAREVMDRILLGFLSDPELLNCPTWVMVNDLAATAMHRLLQERGGLEPLLVGFDNSSDSERLGFDSFEFHTEGMVRQMLHHIANPRAELFAKEPIHEMIGRLVVRTPDREWAESSHLR